MRIAISGTAAMGKSTLITDFLARWKDYQQPEGSYRDVLGKNHSDRTNEETQMRILNWMVDQQLKYDVGDKVIFDRCTLDNLIYTLAALSDGKVSSQFADKCMDIARESLRKLDIIFLIPFDPNIQIVDDGTRCTDIDYIRKIDAYFQTLYDMYLQNDDSVYTMMPKDDMPVIIPIYGSRANRLEMIADYIDETGDLIDTAPEDSVLSEKELEAMQNLLVGQQRILNTDMLGKKFMI